MKKLKPRRLTLEVLDQMLDLYRKEPGDGWDAFMELLWGKASEDDVMIDLLTLARVALVHLKGSSFLLQEPEPGKPKKTKKKGTKHDPRPAESDGRLSRNVQGSSSEAADEDHQGLPPVDTKGIPGGSDTCT